MITSRDNEKLKLVRKLRDRRWRDKLGLFVAEGEDLVAAGAIAPIELLVAGENVAAELLAEVSSLAHPPRVIGVYRREDLPRGPRPVTLALWRVADPGNVGTLLRSADAFGAGVALSAGCADPTGPKALRASMGAIFRVPLAGFEEAAGRRVALVPHGGEPLDQVDLSGEVVFLLGAERERLPDEVLARCDVRASIPQSGDAESLNVAMAGTVALYEVSRRLNGTIDSPTR
ncbi:MAG TPA: RNA methyltransferase [Gaiellaceae bacterium]|nr:RNA methyltransferase [Gaiellaceae bacterium]